ncbi:MAG: hypothetical protein ACRDN8_11710, partial [Thermoleophilaceae bacterium]
MRVGLFGLAVAAALAWPATAWAAFGISNLTAAPVDTTAGAHSDFTLGVEFSDASEDIKDLTVHLPPGLVGNPQAAPRCSQPQFAAASCPSNTKVGSVSVRVTAVILLLPVTLDAPGDIFNIETTGDEPARLGIRVLPVGGLVGDVKLQAPVTLRPGDFGLDAEVNDIPRSFAVTPIDIEAISMTLFDRVNSPERPFMTNPTSCQAAQTTVEATSYARPSTVVGAGDSFTPTDCAGVPFDPALQVAPAAQQADQPGELAVTLTVPGQEEPRRQSHLERAEVTLPVGTALSPGVASNGLDACSDVAFGVGDSAVPACPADSLIGDVDFETPLFPGFDGRVFLAEPKPGRRLRLFVVIESAAPPLRVKLQGDVDADPQTGQITAVFDDLPQLPFTSFTLRFRGGDNAVLTAPPGCGAHTATARLTPWSAPASPATRTAS